MTQLLSQLDTRGVLTLTLNRPEVHNAFDRELIDELTSSLQSAEQDNAVRMVVLTGTGPGFSAGADLNWMRSMISASEQENEQDALQLAGLMRTLNYLHRPTIAMVNGPVFGGGIGLIACCDITIADEAARFGLTETTLGMVPAVVSPYVFHRIGEHNARRYFMTGERFNAGKALQMGLVQEIVPENLLHGALEKVIGNLLKAAPGAALASKKLVNKVAGHDKERQARLDQYTARLIARLRVSEEGQEGLAAFLEKRKPSWLADG
jgi:methylglutaconyl-CoA hydratase